MNTRLVVTDLIIWDVRNQVKVYKHSGDTYENLKKYVVEDIYLKLRLHFDHAPMILSTSIWGDLKGLSTIGGMCEYNSTSLSLDQGEPHQTANTVAHEIGHRIGLFHSDQCPCPRKPCLMFVNPYIHDPVFAQCSISR